jgi:hypothetical protein
LGARGAVFFGASILDAALALVDFFTIETHRYI